MKVALAQINSTSSPAENLELIRQYCKQASIVQAELIVFPEATMANFNTNLAEVAEPLEGDWVQQIRQISNELDITIVAGCFTRHDAQYICNTLILTRPQQQLVAYDKVHLFDALDYQESAIIAAGKKAVVCSYKHTYLGFATCYDLRFPQLFHTLASAGADIIIVCASWGEGQDKLRQWKLLVQARALDTGSWIIACGQAEPPGETNSPIPLGIGHSMVCSPSGEILLEMDNEPGLAIYEFEPKSAIQVRESLGVLGNYKEITEIHCA